MFYFYTLHNKVSIIQDLGIFNNSDIYGNLSDISGRNQSYWNLYGSDISGRKLGLLSFSQFRFFRYFRKKIEVVDHFMILIFPIFSGEIEILEIFAVPIFPIFLG